MKMNPFQVKPMARYDGARYPSPWARAPEPGSPEQDSSQTPNQRLGPAGLLLALVLTLGLAIGVVGCFADYKALPCEHGPRLADGSCPGPDPDPGCPPGTLACDEMALWTCDQDGRWQGQDCEALCDQRGGLDSYSQGCDATAEDPCLCEYDIIDGDIAECTPGQFACLDDGQVQICNDDSYSWTTQACSEYCQETHGAEFISYGCDDQAEEPCLCDYDMLDGVWAGCEPDEVYCQDEDTLMVCAADRYSYDEKACTDYCIEVFGQDYYPTGCDTSDADNLCGCEYGVVDGEPVDP